MKPILFFSLLVMAFVISVAPSNTKGREGAYRAKAINNAKQISIALQEFEATYGHFPGAVIPDELQTAYPPQNRNDSNYILGQLIASEIYDSEKEFTIKGREIADNTIYPPEEILRAGECQFSYISAAGNSPINHKDFPSNTPLLLAPMIRDSNLFDPTFYGNKGSVIYVQLDSSVTHSSVDQGGVAYMSKSKKIKLLDPENNIWKGRDPQIHYPLPYNGAPSRNALNQPRPWSRTEVIYTTALSLIGLSFAYYLFLRFKKQPTIQQ